MPEKKYSFRDEIKLEKRRKREIRAMEDYNRNVIGLVLSSIIFFLVLVTTFLGIRIGGNLSMLFIVLSWMGVFYFGRELKVLPKGQILYSMIKSVLCICMGTVYVVMHKGLWDMMDYGILGMFTIIVLGEFPRIIKAVKKERE